MLREVLRHATLEKWLRNVYVLFFFEFKKVLLFSSYTIIPTNERNKFDQLHLNLFSTIALKLVSSVLFALLLEFTKNTSLLSPAEMSMIVLELLSEQL